MHGLLSFSRILLTSSGLFDLTDAGTWHGELELMSFFFPTKLSHHIWNEEILTFQSDQIWSLQEG